MEEWVLITSQKTICTSRIVAQEVTNAKEKIN
jgi:hypothetical protein